MKYKIESTETLQKTIEIEAEDEIAAIQNVKILYRKEEVVLDDTSYIDTEFRVIK